MKEKLTKKDNGIWSSKAAPIKYSAMTEFLIKSKQMKRRRNAFGFNIVKT